MNSILKKIGPAIIVTAVVLGPGSILTSSRVGASFGLVGIPVIAMAALLMIAMVALAARLGVAYEDSLCSELANRLGRPVAVAIGLTLFTLVALFQSSNNLALIGGLEPLIGEGSLSLFARAAILVVVNIAIVAILYLAQNLYNVVEKLMKLLVAIMILAFLANFLVVFASPRTFEVATAKGSLDWLPLLGMIGTTFSVGGAFYQAYLVKQKGWNLQDTQKSLTDSVLSISILGGITAIILLTAWRTFYGNPAAPALGSVGDVARQLQPLFGSWAKVIFCAGILAGGLSSFLVNALIGGTVMSDSVGRGSNLSDGWPRHLTTVALLVGMVVALASLMSEGSVVHLITFAQALTVLGIPVLALALIYLGTRPELSEQAKPPKWVLTLAIVGFAVACALASLTAQTVYQKVFPETESRVAALVPKM
jgi:manganese transport protein